MQTPLISIYTEMTPNPLAMKFVFNIMIHQGEPAEFTSLEQADQSPLAQRLFDFGFIRSVFIMNNFVTLTRAEACVWDDVIPVLKDFLKAYIEAGETVVVADQNDLKFEGPDAIILRKIHEILETYVKPAVENDGGLIALHSYNEGIVTVALKGSCSGCPSSTITLKQGIQNLLTNMVPEVKEVVALAE